jgi:hypothetical protein
MARHVDEAEHAAIRGRQICEAEIDRDAARLLFLQAVGIDAGEHAHQRRLAMIDMPGCADNHDAGSPSGRFANDRARSISASDIAA